MNRLLLGPSTFLAWHMRATAAYGMLSQLQSELCLSAPIMHQFQPPVCTLAPTSTPTACTCRVVLPVRPGSLCVDLGHDLCLHPPPLHQAAECN
jgi:hypothetical protein